MSTILEVLDATIAKRKESMTKGVAKGIAKEVVSDASYVAQLLGKGDDAILKKIGEESCELVMAAKDSRANSLNGTFNPQYQQKLINEVADVWFHSLVLLGHFDLSSQDVLDELKRREGVSGIAEKASRTQ